MIRRVNGERSTGRRLGSLVALLVVAVLIVGWWRLGPKQARPIRRVEWSKPVPPNVRFESDGRFLEGWVYEPATKDQTGRFPAVIWNHGSEGSVWPWPALVDTYLGHGFVVFIPVRRYHHPSTNGKTIMELIHGASDHVGRWIDLNEEESRDVLNALKWLTKQPYVDPARIVVSGVSFGGVQTLLAAESGAGFRAAIAFAPAAMSWGDGKGKINARMEAAVRNRRIPLFLIQAQNDFSLGPTDVLGPLLETVELQHQVKQYPEFGTRTPGMTDEQWHGLGHGAFAIHGGEVWGPDVFAFIAEAFARPTP